MKRNIPAFIIIGVISLAFTGTVNAGEEGPALSYLAQDPEREMAESVSVLIGWAQGELEEHQDEGLFKDRARDEQLIQDMIAFAKDLQAKGAAAKKAGDMRKARVYYHAAEAAAQYAARMPHMLEARLRKNKANG
ncbi:MAG: hypothetical protein C4528_07100 [Gammaproteobacteria bacterium]|nr:MAG: hypothetical protein C4528_07100 [Gammaproteobacteria bacterium]